jgi:hypothetical protein
VFRIYTILITNWNFGGSTDPSTALKLSGGADVASSEEGKLEKPSVVYDGN